jgi:hypothetical protein
MEINQTLNSSSDEPKNNNLNKSNDTNEILEGIKLL